MAARFLHIGCPIPSTTEMKNWLSWISFYHTNHIVIDVRKKYIREEMEPAQVVKAR